MIEDTDQAETLAAQAHARLERLLTGTTPA